MKSSKPKTAKEYIDRDYETAAQTGDFDSAMADSSEAKEFAATNNRNKVKQQSSSKEPEPQNDDVEPVFAIEASKFNLTVERTGASSAIRYRLHLEKHVADKTLGSPEITVSEYTEWATNLEQVVTRELSVKWFSDVLEDDPSPVLLRLLMPYIMVELWGLDPDDPSSDAIFLSKMKEWFEWFDMGASGGEKARKLEGQGRSRKRSTRGDRNKVEEAKLVEKVLDRLKSGMALAQKNEHSLAIAEYSEAIRLDSKYPLTFFCRGGSYNKLGDHISAIADFSEAIRLDPSHPVSYMGRGEAYKAIGETAKAKADFAMVDKLQAEGKAYTGRKKLHTAEEYIERANNYRDEDDFKNALKDYSKAIKLDPSHRAAFNNRGAIYLMLGKHSNAIADFTEVIRLDPYYLPAYYNRITAYEAKGDKAKATADFARIEVLEQVSQHYNQGASLLKARNYKGAIAEFTKAIDGDSSHYGAYVNRGVSFIRLKDFDNAICDYSEAIRLKPNEYQAYHNRGLAFEKRGDLENAIADYSEIIKLYPNEDLGYFCRGEVYMAKGDFDSAISDFSEAIRTLPNSPIGYTKRAEAYHAKGDKAKSDSDFAKARKLDSADQLKKNPALRQKKAKPAKTNNSEQ
ncbi:MAG: tetratricopeptide repeat protein [Holophagaceae bacterium]|nr:tetratricopeptide repeat protein [Holophagaceae bacterium]